MAKSEVAFIYDKIGRDFSRTRRNNWPEVKKYLSQVKPGQSVLDLGCGNGRLNFDLPSEVDYTGVDVSKVLIDEAKRLFPGRRFILGDILELRDSSTALRFGRNDKDLGSITDKKYDAVFCVAVVHHLDEEEVRRVMGVIRENMGNKGFAVVTCWNLWQRKYWKNHLRSWKSKFGDWRKVTVPYQKTDRLCIAWTKRDLIRMAKDVGFAEVRADDSERNMVLYLRK